MDTKKSAQPTAEGTVNAAAAGTQPPTVPAESAESGVAPGLQAVPAQAEQGPVAAAWTEARGLARAAIQALRAGATPASAAEAAEILAREAEEHGDRRARLALTEAAIMDAQTEQHEVGGLGAIAAARKWANGALEVLAKAAEAEKQLLAEVEANVELTAVGKKKRREAIRARLEEKERGEAWKAFDRAADLLTKRGETLKSAWSRLTEATPPPRSPESLLRTDLRALSVILVGGPVRMADLIHGALEAGDAELAEGLLSTAMVAAPDPIPLRLAARTISGRMAGLQREAVLGDDTKLGLAAELHLVATVRDALVNLRRAAEANPTEVGLLRQHLERTFARIG